MYKLKGENNFFSNPLEQIFKNRNIPIEDIDWFMSPQPYEYDSSLLGNIEEGLELLLKHIESKSHIHVQIDKDLDGMTSSAILINYLRRVFPSINLTWSNHLEDKKHGIDIELVPEAASLLIVPDAGANEYEIHKELYEKGIEILILDHHEAPHYSEYATMINNQLDNYPNKWLSGAGIVYKFIQRMDKKLGLNYANDYVDLVAFGLIGDSMDSSSKETRWLIKKGLSNIKNELLQELIKENVDDGVELNPTVVSFKINPKVNSLLRVGTLEELDDMMKAFLGHQEITINNRLRREDKSETWARRMTRICNNTYARQRRLRDKIFEELDEKIEREKLYENHFIVVEVEGEFEMNMSGYVAMFIVSKYRKPAIVLRKNSEGVLVGSLRGYDPLMSDTKEFLNSLNIFDWAEGHAQACGVQIQPKMRLSLDSKISEALVELDVDESYMVDFEIDSKTMSESFIKEMEGYSHLWGRGIDEPLYAITNIEVRADDIHLIGKARNVLKFSKGNVEYVQFTADPKMIDLKEDGKTVVLNVIGKTGINSWQGNATPQVVIEALEIVEVKDDVFGGFVF